MADALLSIDEARARVLATIAGPIGTEEVALEAAIDRVLAAEIRTAGDRPPFASSAMDGYALGSAGAPSTFSVIGESRAGGPFAGRIEAGEAVRISTGAAVPDGAAAVIRQEDTIAPGDLVETTVEIAAGTNIRGPGEDMRAGALVLEAGARIGPGELAAAITAGAVGLSVARRPVVAVLSTGDELRAPGTELSSGQIHNSNGPMLEALCRRTGATVTPGATVGDDAEQTRDALAGCLERCNLLVVSGGASVGPHDHVKPALESLGVERLFWGVSLQPGKPTWFGRRAERLAFVLPGNPVSAYVTFCLFVAPALNALQGAAPVSGFATEARLAIPVAQNEVRTQAIRVRLETRGAELLAHPTGRQESHMLSSLLSADSLALIPPGPGELAAGELVRLEPLIR